MLTRGSLCSSIVLLLRGETKQKNVLKMPVFFLIQPVPGIQENFKLYFFKCHHQRCLNFAAHIEGKDI